MSCLVYFVQNDTKGKKFKFKFFFNLIKIKIIFKRITSICVDFYPSILTTTLKQSCIKTDRIDDLEEKWEDKNEKPK